MENRSAFLPSDFLLKMKNFPEIDYTAFLDSYEKPPFRGILRNPLKCGEEQLRAVFGTLLPAPFGRDSYYLPHDFGGVGKLPLHHAGALYAQEPSAACAATVLAPRPGERILDLCAAPGGKSAQIAGLLMGQGLLWSNEMMRDRAQALLSNLERLGVRNAVVSSCHPEVLCRSLAGFFDRVLVDAPCSGEGMFRRDQKAAAEWTAAHAAACAGRQLAILNSAKQAVRPGGVLVYSTCTFSPEENEGVADRFLSGNPDFEAEDCGVTFGRAAIPALGGGRESLKEAGRRVFPMDGGEGHFVVRFRKKGEARDGAPAARKVRANPELLSFYRRLFLDEPWGSIEEAGGKIALVPPAAPDLAGKGVLRAGVWLGERAKGRIEPCHGAFMAAAPGAVRSCLRLSSQEEQTMAFLRGEEIPCEQEPGYAGVAVDGVMLGFGKVSGGRLKNRYPKGLRNLK